MVNATPKRRNKCKIALNTSSALALLFAASVPAAELGAYPASDFMPTGIVGTGNKDFSEVTPSGIVGTGNKDFSEVTPSGIVGTGNKGFSEATPSGIVGTGNKGFSEATPSGIVGTGNKSFSEVTPSGIVGTGNKDFSEVTPSGIVGTGNKDFSEVTPSGIVGTGNKDFSEVTPSGIVGTGNKDFSEITPSGIVGTGNKGFSEVTPSGIVGTGNKGFSEVTPSGIVGTGNKDFSEVTPNGIVGTGNKGFSEVTPSGIVGTGVMTINAENSYLRFLKWANQVNPAGSPLVVYGPVEAILENKAVALGQDVFLAGFSAPIDLSVGQTVAVFGIAREDGIDATKILRVTEPHVEGSSPVYLSGIVTGQERLDGAFKIGEILVQIGEAGVNPSAYEVESLDFVEITGIKIGDIILADTVN